MNPPNGVVSLVSLSDEIDPAWIIPPIQPKIVHPPGKASIVADVLSWSMPPTQQNKPKEQDQQQLTYELKGQDNEGERFLFMIMLIITRISAEELKDFEETQKAHPLLEKLRELSAADLN